jgi:phage gp36-like protein
LSGLRKKHNDAVAELTDQLEQIQKLKAKTEKDKAQAQRELADASAAADSELRAKQDAEKTAKSLEIQVNSSPLCLICCSWPSCRPRPMNRVVFCMISPR